MRPAALLALPFVLVGVVLAGAGSASADPAEPSATPDRQPDANGWYTAPVTVRFGPPNESWACSDPVSYSGPDTTGAAVSGSCTKGDETVQLSYELRYDATAPTDVTGAADRGPDAGGWYNRPFGVTFTGRDAASGIASCTSASYGGPDAAQASVEGRCTDQAGHSASASVSFKYDATPPSAAGKPGRDPDANGWYREPVTISFEGTDAGSGIASCSGSVTYSGPESGAAEIAGSCSDQAGNSAGATVRLKYDGSRPDVTATPGRPPDVAGWYNRPLSVSFAGSDSGSGVASCSGPTDYDGPDDASATVSGTCTDNAGNTGSGSATFRYDDTPPAVTASPARPPDASGWYNRPVAIAFKGTDATSGIASCSDGSTYAGPDSASASLSGACTDTAGNSATDSFSLKYDETPPVLDLPPPKVVEADGPSGAAKVTFTLPTASDARNPEALLVSCNRTSPSSFPLGTTKVRCEADDGHGNTTAGTLDVVVRDSTPPTLNVPRPLSVSTGQDSVPRSDPAIAAYLASPTASDLVDGAVRVTNSAPDRIPVGVTRITWSAVDKAGNKSTESSTITVARSASGGSTATVVSGVAGRPAGALDTSPPGDVRTLRAKAASRKVTFTWRNPAESDFARIVVLRSPSAQPGQAEKVYDGKDETFVESRLQNGVSYRWTFRAFDGAGNGSRGVVVTATPKQLLLWEPVDGARLAVGSQFILVWARTPGAGYYNVQLFYGKEKVGTFWPRQPRLILGRSWKFAGRKQTLKRGEYRWFVWPGLGDVKASRYGPVLGASRFVVRELRPLKAKPKPSPKKPSGPGKPRK
jgi:hypothetical protein